MQDIKFVEVVRSHPMSLGFCQDVSRDGACALPSLHQVPGVWDARVNFGNMVCVLGSSSLCAWIGPVS